MRIQVEQENPATDTMKNTDEKIEILNQIFFFLEKNHGREPIVMFWIYNNTPYIISSIDFRAELKSQYEEIPWVEDDFGFTPDEWINPYETFYAEFNFAFNWNWDNPDIKEADAELTIEVLNAYDTLSDLILFEKSSD
ncbi:MAG: hypothetical protein JXB48_18235 [Candidatus Latescibacteria bacterium]|nr:hypothetical protein [Candidatus Latescibacterota bacterium]